MLFPWDTIPFISETEPGSYWRMLLRSLLHPLSSTIKNKE